MAQVSQRRGVGPAEVSTSAADAGREAMLGPLGPVSWLVAGGLAGAVASALFSVVVPPQEMMPMVAALYGLEGVVWGWVFHLLHGAAFGVVFAVLAWAVRDLTSGPGALASSAVLGAVYGAVVWLVFAAFVMPAWIGAVTDMDPPVPDWNRLSLMAHVVYGVGLAVLLPVLALANRRPPVR